MSAEDPRLPGVVGWPAEVARRYREAGHWAGVTLGDELDTWARRRPDRVAVVDGDRRMSYAELAAASARVAGHLRALGIGRDDRVVVQLPNGLAFCVLVLALLRLGAPPVMALVAHRGREISYLVDHAQAAGLAVPASARSFDHHAMATSLRHHAPQLRHIFVAGEPQRQDAIGIDGLLDEEPPPSAVADAPEPGDIALFLLSGGTTGLPKLIPRTHDDYAYNARASAELCGFDADTVYLAALPAAHNFALACPGLLGTWHAGGRVVLTDDPRPQSAFALIEREGVTVTSLVPTLALRWIDSPERQRFDLSSLALVQVGGARMPAEAAQRLQPALGARLQQVFGMAEGLLNYTRLDDPDDVVVETQGRPLSVDDELLIVDAGGQPVAPGEPGELLTRGPYTLRGYYRAPEHNARAFTADGYYRTGDVVVRRDDGNLVVHGREKDLINRGGEKISAEEVENLALAHPTVREAAAVAMPDRELGERTCLFVVLHDGATLDLAGLVAFLEDQDIARFKLPERLEVVGALPLTNVGKVDKRALREAVEAQLRAEGRTCRG